MNEWQKELVKVASSWGYGREQRVCQKARLTAATCQVSLKKGLVFSMLGNYSFCTIINIQSIKRIVFIGVYIIFLG
ncbi:MULTISPECIES: hypothetical protein [unclassified Lysinibacillus]|uniref:hypothetical protein n=1 Tax=unclassified Lysinibacillus TaxID=2636778 RepID=UPI003810BB1F